MASKRISPGVVGWALSLVLSVASLLCPTQAQAQETLTAALYPYVPEARDLFDKLAVAFAATHPGVNVELVEQYTDPQATKTGLLSDDYYDGGLLKAKADIYEIDTILLADMVQSGKIASIDPPQRDFLPEAHAAVHIDGKTWGVPHWICGNFLFYARGDIAIEHASTWQELVAAFQSGGSFVGDFTGTATLAEWYLTSLAAVDGEPTSVVKRLRSPELMTPAVEALRALLQLCPVGYCRSTELHSQPGSYARMFARGKARAYIGYSETIHYGLQEIAEHCGPTDGCRSPDQIAVRAIPPLTPRGRSVGWVDALAISATLTDKKRRLATEFVEFVTSWDAYALVLNPAGSAAPRYLLLPFRDFHQSPMLKPPLYQAFSKAFGSRVILTAEGLSGLLRTHGKALAYQLVPERGDLRRQAPSRQSDKE